MGFTVMSRTTMISTLTFNGWGWPPKLTRRGQLSAVAKAGADARAPGARNARRFSSVKPKSLFRPSPLIAGIIDHW